MLLEVPMKTWAAASLIRRKFLAHRAGRYLMRLSPACRADHYIAVLVISCGMLGIAFYTPDPIEVLKAEVQAQAK
jgi:hypothetical protein